MDRGLPLVFIVLDVLFFPLCSTAHLSIVRQGLDSNGSLESNDAMGSSLAAGDFNGDGYDDLALGAVGETLSGQSSAGSVIVVYGSEVGLTHVGSEFLSAGTAGETDLPFAEFGRALASGYFDDDLYADLAIGNPFETVSGVEDVGRVYVYYGGPGGLPSTPGIILDQTDAGGALEAGDEFGASLATGDFNGDGRDDLAVGGPGEDTNAGAIFHFYSNATGITTLGAGFFKQSGLGGTNVSGDRFGSALAAGNLIGTTNHDDLAASAPYREVSGMAGAGVVYLVSGSPGGLTSAGAFQYDADDPSTLQASSEFGYSLAVGQFASGTYAWLAVGEPKRNSGLQTQAGRALAAPGGNLGIDWTSYRLLSPATGAGTAETGDHFGFALAAGDWNEDGLDDLAVGSPFEDAGAFSDVGAIADAGQVRIILGGNSVFSAPDSLIYHQQAIYDSSETLDKLGFALAFGRFDDSGRANLAAGAPGEDTSFDIVLNGASLDVEEYTDAGGAYILAPWRQPKAGGATQAAGDIPCRSSVATDCMGNIIFSQRPFDRVRPASTTKVMCLLLACEHIQNGTADSNSVYIVPSWVGSQVGGTTIDMVTDEEWSLMDIMYYTIIKSGNDGAYAIADEIAYGGTAEDFDVSDFVTEMNARAWALGMTGTQFANPAGRDSTQNADLVIQDNYTTAADMAILGRAAMENALFREILSWQQRNVIVNRLSGGPLYSVRIYSQSGGMIPNLQNLLSEANGIKTGLTTKAGRSRLVSAEKPALGLVVAGMYAIHQKTPTSSQLYPILVELLTLGLKRCDPMLILLVPPPEEEQLLIRADHVSTSAGSEKGGGVEIVDSDNDSVSVEVYRQSGTGTASVFTRVARDSRANLDMGEVASYRIEPFTSHQGFTIENSNEAGATLDISLTHPPGQSVIYIPPGETLALPPYMGTPATAFELNIANVSSPPLALEIRELGYGFDVTLDPSVPGGSVFTALLPMTTSAVQTVGLTLTGRGLDTSAGSEVLMVARRTRAAPLAAPMDPESSPAFRLLPASPNPFSVSTRLDFELDARATVEVALCDVQGRRVKLWPGRDLEPGVSSVFWDGDDDRGLRVTGGVYFFWVRRNGQPAGVGKVVFVP